MLYVKDYTLLALKVYPQFQFKLIDLLLAGAERLVLHDYGTLTIQHGWLPSQPPASQTHLTSCCSPHYCSNSNTQHFYAQQFSLNNFSSPPAHRKNKRITRRVLHPLLCSLIWDKTPRAVPLYTNQQTSATLMVRKKISYLPALTTDLGCLGTEDSLSGAPDAKSRNRGQHYIVEKRVVGLVVVSLL